MSIEWVPAKGWYDSFAGIFFTESIKQHQTTSRDIVRHQKDNGRHQRTSDDISRHHNPSNDIKDAASGFGISKQRRPANGT